MRSGSDREVRDKAMELLADLGRKFPHPPPELDLPAAIKTLSTGAELWRIYFQGGAHPTTWSLFRTYGPTDGRFDHHLAPNQGRGILYAAEAVPTCLAEVFQSTRTIDLEARDPWLVGFRLATPLELLDLTGTWPTRAGASMALNSGPRSRARLWSRLIYDAYPKVQGIYYPSSMAANQPAIALYERAEASLPVMPTFHRPLADPALLTPFKKAAANFGYGLV